MSKWADQGFLLGSLQRGPGRASRAVQLFVDPAYEVAVGQVSHEQEEAIGRLIKPPVAEVRTGQGTGIDVIGVRAGEAGFVISAASPVAAKLWAGGAFLMLVSISDQDAVPCLLI